MGERERWRIIAWDDGRGDHKWAVIDMTTRLVIGSYRSRSDAVSAVKLKTELASWGRSQA